jgi:ferredoxin-NADP reductase
MKLRIATIEPLSPTIRRFTLRGDQNLPAGAAGAHVIVDIPGPNRVWKNAYSLAGQPGDTMQYEIIVRRVEHSRGGSAWLHDHAAVGDELAVSAPQNLFPIARTAQHHLLLSAGIGVTPFLAYRRALTTPYTLHHCCRPEDEAAFTALLAPAKNVHIHTSRNALNLTRVLASQKLNTQLYVCGPEGFMEDVLDVALRAGWPASKIHRESFGGATGGAPFTVRLERTRRDIHVGADETLLEALEAAGLAPPCLCRGGACGECELKVLDGVPEHRDHFLSPAARAGNGAIMTCVSRAKTPSLVLDF